MPLLTVMLPTYNEAENIGPLVGELRAALVGIDHEVLVVDDDSPDGTQHVAREAGARVVVRKGERGLATAVVRGFQEARGDYVCVMDGDGQHPPETIRRMIERARQDGADLVIGSRYAEGGSVGGFGPLRRLISTGAASISKMALPAVREHRVTDPMSGLFMVRRSRLDPAVLRPTGYKILLEILGRSHLDRVSEVGYTFQTRRAGDSKLGSGVIFQYLAHVMQLGLADQENRRMARFGLVGLSGVVVNLGILWLMHGLLGLHATLSAAVAVEASILSNFFLNDAFTFHDRRHRGFAHRWLRFQLVSMATLVINLGVFSILHGYMDLWYLAAEAIAIVVAFAANYAGNLTWTYARPGAPAHPRPAWAPWVLFGLLVAGAGWMYFHDLDSVEQMYFDETFYLAVAKQMDNGIWHDPCWGDAQKPLNAEHPPVGKLIMWASSSWFDDYHGIFPGCREPDVDPPPGQEMNAFRIWEQEMNQQGNQYAWRAPGAFMAVLTLLGAGMATARIFNSSWAGIAAAGLVAMDGLVLTSARIALLDIYAAGFIALAFWAATYPTRSGAVWCGLLLGLAFSSKYTVFFAGPGLLLLAYWVHARARRLSKGRFDLLTLAIPLLPLVVWLLSYMPWWVQWIPDKGILWSIEHFYEQTKSAFAWQTVENQSSHPYESGPVAWITISKPIYYYVAPWSGATSRHIWAFGNPILWWLGSAAVVYGLLEALFSSVWTSIRHLRSPLAWFRSRTPEHQGFIMLALAAFLAWAGFLALTRVLFIFYMTSVTPILAMAAAGGLYLVARRGIWGKTIAMILGLLAFAAFVTFYPLWTAQPITDTQHNALLQMLPARR